MLVKGQIAARWEATTVNLCANTRAAYRNLLCRYLLPTFGPMPLADLDAMAVRAWLAKLERDGVGASTRAKAYRLLSRILCTAVESGYLARNPCTIRGAAAEPAPEMRFTTVAEVAALADAIPRWFRALVLVAASTGLRWGVGRPPGEAGGPAAPPDHGGRAAAGGPGPVGFRADQDRCRSADGDAAHRRR
jgi:integrase